MFRRERNPKRGGFKFSSDSAWDPKTTANQRNIGGSAVRTEGNPWGDADGGKGHIADMASDAWKKGGY